MLVLLKSPQFFHNFGQFLAISSQNNFSCTEINHYKAFHWENMLYWKGIQTEKLFLIRVPQYWANGVKGGCKGDE